MAWRWRARRGAAHVVRAYGYACDAMVRNAKTKSARRPRIRAPRPVAAGPRPTVRDVLVALRAAQSRDPIDWLPAEKARRGRAPDDLVFVGTHNIAQLIWCPMFARLKSVAKEGELFNAYLTDRVRWAAAAGLVRGIPSARDEWLEVGSSLTLGKVESLRAREAPAKRLPVDDKYRAWVRSLSPEGAAQIVAMGGNFETGAFYEARYAEDYPKLRWHFEWGQRVVVGEADGLRRLLVYEFKTAKKRFFLDESRAISFAQADLYGFFFRRKTKRVQIAVRDDGKVETWEEPVDTANAASMLARFHAVVGGARVDAPPPGKCRSCEFRDECALAPPFATTKGGKEIVRSDLIRRRHRAAEARRGRGDSARVAASSRFADDAERFEDADPADRASADEGAVADSDLDALRSTVAAGDLDVYRRR